MSQPGLITAILRLPDQEPEHFILQPAGLTSENVKRLKDDVMAAMGKHLSAQNLATEDADNMLEEVVSDSEADGASQGRQKQKKRKKPGKRDE